MRLDAGAENVRVKINIVVQRKGNFVCKRHRDAICELVCHIMLATFAC
jgi:hypothetical protein